MKSSRLWTLGEYQSWQGMLLETSSSALSESASAAGPVLLSEYSECLSYKIPCDYATERASQPIYVSLTFAHHDSA